MGALRSARGGAVVAGSANGRASVALGRLRKGDRARRGTGAISGDLRTPGGQGWPGPSYPNAFDFQMGRLRLREGRGLRGAPFPKMAA